MNIYDIDGTESTNDVIRKMLEAICVESWLDEKDGCELLRGIFELYDEGRFYHAHRILNLMDKLSRSRKKKNVEDHHYRDGSINSVGATPE